MSFSISLGKTKPVMRGIEHGQFITRSGSITGATTPCFAASLAGPGNLPQRAIYGQLRYDSVDYLRDRLGDNGRACNDLLEIAAGLARGSSGNAGGQDGPPQSALGQ